MLSVSVPKSCDLACLLPPLWHLGGTSSDPGAIASTRRVALGSRLGILLIFVASRAAFDGFLANLGANAFFLLCLFLGPVLMVKWSGLGCRGFQDQAFRVKRVFTYIGILSISA